MVDRLHVLIESFPGAENRAQCFNHVTALVAKSAVRQFDVPKGKADSALDEAERELRELAEGLDIEESITEDEWEEADEENENENLPRGEDNDSWVDEVAALSPRDREELEAQIQPVKLVLVKVSHQRTLRIAVSELTKMPL
jgi:hypothetical protein